jgi:5-amino-6-(5-phospho-D-ribitylamino)uracil phosphatase
MAYKLIALDMDGTLLGRNGAISEENEKWIRAAVEAGVKVTFATGRPLHEVVNYREQLGLDVPLVINNGSEVWITPTELHIRHEISSELIGRIFETIEAYGEDVQYWAHTVNGKIDRKNLPGDVHEVQWLQFAIRTERADYLREIHRELASWNVFEISNSHITNIECNAQGVSKASGIQEVCDLLGIRMSEVIAMGDSWNDIPMIRAAGLGIAMGNAQAEVKEAADAIAPNHDQDGVAQMIRKYCVKI